MNNPEGKTVQNCGYRFRDFATGIRRLLISEPEAQDNIEVTVEKSAIESPTHGIVVICMVVTAFAILSTLGCMHAHQGAQQDRTPPSWSPEMRNYTFREWSRDVLLWQLRSDPNIDDSRRAAAIVAQLRGSARVWSQQIPPQILLNGGNLNGVHADPVTYVITGLAERFGVLGEEARIGAMADLFGFHRSPNGGGDELMTRDDVIRSRSQEQRQMMIATERV
ncbi:MAG: hypothetical protein GY894_00220, partial [Planctomycetes bacterium]|nr:hypothetical protein [Planctomycetota bacterium]